MSGESCSSATSVGKSYRAAEVASMTSCINVIDAAEVGGAACALVRVRQM